MTRPHAPVLVLVLVLVHVPVLAAPPASGAAPPAAGSIAVAPEPAPPEFPRKPDGTLDREALIRELEARRNTPEARAEAERRRLEDINEPGHRISPLFGSEFVFFKNLDRTQSSWGVLYRAFMRWRWALVVLVVGLAGGIFIANQLRWRRLERDFLGDRDPERTDG